MPIGRRATFRNRSMEARHEGNSLFDNVRPIGRNARLRPGSVAGRHLDRPARPDCEGRGTARRPGHAGHHRATGQTFVGRLKRSNATGDEEEPLWGAFTPGVRLMMGADGEGTYIFTLLDQNTLDYCYSEAGPSPRAVCARLIRQR